MNSEIIQIVPRRTSRPDGIGDYGTQLAQAVFRQAGLRSLFISGTPAQLESPRADCWQTECALNRSGHALANQLSRHCRDRADRAVILHISGYGYAKRGAPLWLLNGMRLWRRTQKNGRLFGIFHELFATGPMWNSSFWLSGMQKYVTRSLWDLCDGGLTTTAKYFDQLASWRPQMRQRLNTMPVFSNVGEPGFIVPPESRPPNMAVFGQAGTEYNIYAGPQCMLTRTIAEKLGVLKLIDIGARIDPPPAHLEQLTITSLGQLPPNEVSLQLMACRFGLLNYDVARLQKSGVFAAYAAHGVIPICIGSRTSPPPGLEEGTHFLRWPFKMPADLGAIQRSLRQWYQGHSVSEHAALVMSWCSSLERAKR
jgi:hypothetical protein